MMNCYSLQHFTTSQPLNDHWSVRGIPMTDHHERGDSAPERGMLIRKPSEEGKLRAADHWRLGSLTVDGLMVDMWLKSDWNMVNGVIYVQSQSIGTKWLIYA